MKKVLITRRIPEIAKSILSEFFQVDDIEKNKPFDYNSLLKIVNDYEIILCTVSERFDKKLINQASNLEVLSNYASGLDNIDVDYSKSKGISVYNTPDVVTNSTADLTLALLLALSRKIISANNYVRNGKWDSWNPEIFLGHELYGKNYGIIGFGKIGKAVARRVAGFGLNVLVYNRTKINDKSLDHKAIKQVKIEELLSKSHFISTHLSLNEKTRSFIDYKSFLQMSKKPIFINMSRGEIVNTDDLCLALKNNLIQSAGLDVVNPMPLKQNHELNSFNNCLIVPHIGTATEECRVGMARLASENIVNHYKLK